MHIRDWHLVGVFAILCHLGGSTSWAETSREAYLKGVEDYAASHFEDAAEAFQRAVQHDPSNHEAQLRLAQTNEQLRKIPEAIAAYQKLEPFRKFYPDLDFIIAKLYYNIQENDAALLYFKKAETTGIRVQESQYFQAYIHYLKNEREKAKAFFMKMEDQGPDKALRQGAKLYLATIRLDEEATAIEKTKLKGTLSKLDECIKLDEKSPVADAARRKRSDVEAMLQGKNIAAPTKRYSAYLTEDIEYDDNILNENNNTTNPTNAKAFKFTTFANFKYRLIDEPSFYAHPAISANYLKHLATDGTDQPTVSTSDAFTTTGYLYLASKKPIEKISTGIKEIKAQTLEVSYPVKAAVTYNDANGDSTWSWFSLAFSLNPSLKFQFFEPHYSTVGLDYSYNLNANGDLTTHSIGGNGSQSYAFIPKLLDSALVGNVNYIFGSNDRVSMTLGASLFYFAPWQISITPGINLTWTHNIVLTDRGEEQSVSATLAFNRVFFNLIAVNLHYAYETLFSKAASAEYSKNRIGIKGTYSF